MQTLLTSLMEALSQNPPSLDTAISLTITSLAVLGTLAVETAELSPPMQGVHQLVVKQLGVLSSNNPLLAINDLYPLQQMFG